MSQNQDTGGERVSPGAVTARTQRYINRLNRATSVDLSHAPTYSAGLSSSGPLAIRSVTPTPPTRNTRQNQISGDTVAVRMSPSNSGSRIRRSTRSGSNESSSPGQHSAASQGPITPLAGSQPGLGSSRNHLRSDSTDSSSSSSSSSASGGYPGTGAEGNYAGSSMSPGSSTSSSLPARNSSKMLFNTFDDEPEDPEDPGDPDDLSDTIEFYPGRRPVHWLYMFGWYLYQYACYGMKWPSRQPRVFVGAVVLSGFLFYSVICSAGPICAINHPIYVLLLYLRDAFLECIVTYLLYVLFILGYCNAFNGAVRWIESRAVQSARRPVPMTTWALPVEPWKYLKTNFAVAASEAAYLIFRPLLMLTLAVLFAEFVPFGSNPIKTFIAAFQIHLIKWICQAIDTTLAQRGQLEKGRRLVFWTVFGSAGWTLLCRQMYKFEYSSNWALTQAFLRDADNSCQANKAILGIDGPLGAHSRIVLDKLYRVTVFVMTAGITPAPFTTKVIETIMGQPATG